MSVPADRTRFVNPYSFAPLPTTVLRRVPPGHDGRAYLPNGRSEQLYSGSITVTWTLKTPYLLPAADSPRQPKPVSATYRIPGSSVKGALRSVHETMFGGCLREVDEKYLPSYRSSAQTRTERSWYLAQVVESNRLGRPTRLRLCGDIDWIDGPSLRRAYNKLQPGLLPTSGDTFATGSVSESTTLNRYEMRDVVAVSDVVAAKDACGSAISAAGTFRLQISARDGDHLLLVTDIGARHPRKRTGDRGRCLWASGVLSNEYIDEVPAAVVDNYISACSDADDRRRLLAPSKAAAGRRDTRPRATDDPAVRRAWRGVSQYDTVTWWPDYASTSVNPAERVPTARRRLTSGLLFPGDVVWAELADDNTTLCRLDESQIWREVGTHPLQSRVPPAVLPCTDPGFDQSGPGLCLSCEIFGAIDASGKKLEGGSRQSAYAGHVRFGAAMTVGPVVAKAVQLAPLGTPHPGAGMFYLDPSEPLSASRKYGDKPGRWGSAADEEMPRQVRGRKFFWHSDPDEQAQAWTDALGKRVVPRYQVRDHQRQSGEARHLLPAGTELTQLITVDGISRTGLQSLLGVLIPGIALGTGAKPEFAHHLGGGKPFGLGTVVARCAVSVQTVGDRYVAQPTGGTVSTPEQVGFELAKSYLDARVVEPLQILMDMDGLGHWRNHVTYPTTVNWDQLGTEAFDLSFKFFVNNTGERLKTGDKPWAPLPGPPGPAFNPSLPITPISKRSPTSGPYRSAR